MVSAIATKRSKRGGQRVLLVEDDPVLALDLEAALLDAGAREVVICPTMAAALAYLEQSRPDAIILDVHLADRDDGWALAELAGMLATRLPRIAFSTGSPEDIPPAIRELGPVFEKPYDSRHLADVLLNQKKTGLIERLRDALR
ncbi:response regulator [Altererythrobacter sp. KTW20L]|uniref:response regulator n=1 Tax=Altererythrobacter sp. KTW20L TaxID=2942210 RepID=UPI0020C15CD8|nr:response regulator [Altererythrobacter sp. KTW20L]MCL6250863.1 response regulator [Altererythrobacter sp. KTW20L]